MKYSRLLIFTLVGIVCLLMSSCWPAQPSISREDAIKIAQERVAADKVMSLTGRIPVVEVEKDYWHVSFPLVSEEQRGGEPHVLIDKKTGNVIKVYYTQ